MFHLPREKKIFLNVNFHFHYSMCFHEWMWMCHSNESLYTSLRSPKNSLKIASEEMNYWLSWGSHKNMHRTWWRGFIWRWIKREMCFRFNKQHLRKIPYFTSKTAIFINLRYCRYKTMWNIEQCCATVMQRC